MYAYHKEEVASAISILNNKETNAVGKQTFNMVVRELINSIEHSIKSRLKCMGVRAATELHSFSTRVANQENALLC